MGEVQDAPPQSDCTLLPVVHLTFCARSDKPATQVSSSVYQREILTIYCTVNQVTFSLHRCFLLVFM